MNSNDLDTLGKHRVLLDEEQWRRVRYAFRNLEVRLNDAGEMLKFHPRAAKLMGKKKEFLVVAHDEPYYLQVYDLIRDHEMDTGRWTVEDERAWLAARKAKEDEC